MFFFPILLLQKALKKNKKKNGKTKQNTVVPLTDILLLSQTYKNMNCLDAWLSIELTALISNIFISIIYEIWYEQNKIRTEGWIWPKNLDQAWNYLLSLWNQSWLITGFPYGFWQY